MNTKKLTFRDKAKIAMDVVWNFPFMFLFIMALFAIGFFLYDGVVTKLVIGVVLLVIAEVFAATNMPLQAWFLGFTEEKTVKSVIFDIRQNTDAARRAVTTDSVVPKWKVVLIDGTHARALRRTKRIDMKPGDSVVVLNTLFGERVVKL